MDENGKVVLQVMDPGTVIIPLTEYRELTGKAARLDAIAESIRDNARSGRSEYNRVNDEVVLLLTGTKNYKRAPADSEATDE